MKKPYALMLAAFIALEGCATAPKMNNLSVGMTKQDVVSILGQPDSCASPGSGLELLHYRLSTTFEHRIDQITNVYFVRMVNGKVESYGQVDDVNIKNR